MHDNSKYYTFYLRFQILEQGIIYKQSCYAMIHFQWVKNAIFEVVVFVFHVIWPLSRKKGEGNIEKYNGKILFYKSLSAKIYSDIKYYSTFR